MLTERCATWASTFTGLSKDSTFPAAVLQLKGCLLTLGREALLRDWLAMENSHVHYAFSTPVEPRDPFSPNAFDRLKRKTLAPKCQRSTKWKRGRIIFKRLKQKKKNKKGRKTSWKKGVSSWLHLCSILVLLQNCVHCISKGKGKGLWHKSTNIQKNKHKVGTSPPPPPPFWEIVIRLLSLFDASLEIDIHGYAAWGWIQHDNEAARVVINCVNRNTDIKGKAGQAR